MALIVAVAGCQAWRPAPVGPLLPILEQPAPPQLARIAAAELASVSPEIAQRLLSRDAALKEALRRCRDVIEDYNAWARQENRKHGYERREQP